MIKQTTHTPHGEPETVYILDGDETKALVRNADRANWMIPGAFLLGVAMTVSWVVPESTASTVAGSVLWLVTMPVLGRASAGSWRRVGRTAALPLFIVVALALAYWLLFGEGS